MCNVPTYGNKFQGQAYALLTSRGTKAVTGVASLTPFVLTLDEILDLHGCKSDANKVANIEHSIFTLM